MEVRFSKNWVEFEKELNSLDRFVIDFVSVLDKLGIRYVLVSGYVAILFGRSRTSEDIDLIIEKMDFNGFLGFWKGIKDRFECIITDDPANAYKDYLTTNHSIRFARKGTFIPNMEIKFPKTDLDEWTLKERKEVIMNKKRLFISPFELQIPFKLFLGSEKDIEDAKHIYKLFKDKLDMRLLNEFNRKLKIEGLFNKYLR